MPSSNFKRNAIVLLFVFSILLTPLVSLGGENIGVLISDICPKGLDKINAIPKFGMTELIQKPPLKRYYDSISECSSGITEACLDAIATALTRDAYDPSLNSFNDPLVKNKMAGKINTLASALSIYASCPNQPHFRDVENAQADVQNATAVSFEGIANQVGARNETNIERETHEENSGEEGTCPLIKNSIPYCSENFLKSLIPGFLEGMTLPNALTISLYMIARGLLTWVLKIFQWLLYPANFNGYINFLNPHPGPNNPSLVPQLWSFARNLANLGIIIGIIVMAIATILRIEKYSWKKMLPKLVLVALLVNFSLVIAGIFVDISNYISIAAVKAFGNNSLASLVVNCGVCPVVWIYFNKISNAWALFGTVRAAGMGLILSSLFLFQFVGLLFYVFTRIVTIIICLITSPLAFFSFAIPGGEKIWDLWRKQFQQAIVILPVLCLTLLLSLKFIVIVVINLANNLDKDHFLILLGYTGFIIVFAQLVRYVAKFLGVEQVEKGFQLAKKAVNTIAMAGAAAVGGIAIPKIMESKAFQKVGEGLTHVPLLSGVGQQMMTKGEKNKADRISKYEKELDGVSLSQLKALEKAPMPSPLDRPGYERRIALTNQLAKIKELGDESIEFIKKHIQDRNFDQLAISYAVPQHFRIEEGEFKETGPTLENKVQALGGIKENKISELTQAKEFIEDTIKTTGKDFDEVIREIIKTLNPAQLNAFWRAISAKALIEKGWKDKIIHAIESDPQTSDKFYKEMLPVSRGLQEISGKKPIEEEEEKKPPIVIHGFRGHP